MGRLDYRAAMSIRSLIRLSVTVCNNTFTTCKLHNNFAAAQSLCGEKTCQVKIAGIHNEIGDQHLTEGAVYFRRGGIVLQDATGATLGTTIGAPLRLESKVHPPPFHQVFMCCLQRSLER